jgi:predicted RNase H-like HicB family nuclease
MGGGYVICFPDLYGFSIHAASLEQAKADIEQAKKEWYEAAVKEGRPIPLPYEYIKREA